MMNKEDLTEDLIAAAAANIGGFEGLKEALGQTVNRHFAASAAPEAPTPQTFGRGSSMVTIYKLHQGKTIEMQARKDKLEMPLAEGWKVRDAAFRLPAEPKVEATAPESFEEIPPPTEEEAANFVESILGLEKVAPKAVKEEVAAALDPVPSQSLADWMTDAIPDLFGGKKVRKSQGAEPAVVGEVPSAMLHKAALKAGHKLECQDRKKPCRGNYRDCEVRLERRRLAEITGYPLRVVPVEEGKQASPWGRKFIYGN